MLRHILTILHEEILTEERRQLRQLRVVLARFDIAP